MARKRWTPGFEDEIRRTTFEGQIDIAGAVAPRDMISPPPPRVVEEPRPDYVYGPDEQPSLFDDVR